MSNVTIINITMSMQGPPGEPGQDAELAIDDMTISTESAWSSSKTSEEIENTSIIYAIAFG